MENLTRFRMPIGKPLSEDLPTGVPETCLKTPKTQNLSPRGKSKGIGVSFPIGSHHAQLMPSPDGSERSFMANELFSDSTNHDGFVNNIWYTYS
jgi:hypothetical protein